MCIFGEGEITGTELSASQLFSPPPLSFSQLSCGVSIIDPFFSPPPLSPFPFPPLAQPCSLQKREGGREGELPILFRVKMYALVGAKSGAICIPLELGIRQGLPVLIMPEHVASKNDRRV